MAGRLSVHWIPRIRNLIGGQAIIELASELRWRLPQDFHDSTVESIPRLSGIAAQCVQTADPLLASAGNALDRWLSTSGGLPTMAYTNGGVGLRLKVPMFPAPCSPVSSSNNSTPPKGFADSVCLSGWMGFSQWCLHNRLGHQRDVATHGNLSPFTLLEDFRYLPSPLTSTASFKQVGRTANRRLPWQWATVAAGVIATRVIDSPRERLIAILTNNFALCNGRWPTQILIASIFIGALAPKPLAGLIAAIGVFTVAAFGILLTFLVSFGLSRTLLKGTASAFSLEPPTALSHLADPLYLPDRSHPLCFGAQWFLPFLPALSFGVFVILTWAVNPWRWAILGLDPFATTFGLTGVILLAYVVAIPANEIVITILMLTVMVTGVAVEAPVALALCLADDLQALARYSRRLN